MKTALATMKIPASLELKLKVAQIGHDVFNLVVQDRIKYSSEALEFCQRQLAQVLKEVPVKRSKAGYEAALRYIGAHGLDAASALLPMPHIGSVIKAA